LAKSKILHQSLCILFIV